MAERLLAPDGSEVVVEEFDHAGAALVVEDFGVGRPFVLLHGIGMGRGVYGDLASHLTGRVIAVDLPGFGEAPEPERTLTMARHADQRRRARGAPDRGVRGAAVSSGSS